MRLRPSGWPLRRAGARNRRAPVDRRRWPDESENDRRQREQRRDERREPQQAAFVAAGIVVGTIRRRARVVERAMIAADDHIGQKMCGRDLEREGREQGFQDKQVGERQRQKRVLAPCILMNHPVHAPFIG